jgi:hypothetical protein
MFLKIKKEDSTGTFPQANDIYKVIKYVDMKIDNRFDQYLSTVVFEFVPRQYAYYRSAAAYLGLLDGDAVTPLARKIFAKNKDDMLLSIACLILEHEAFYTYHKNHDISQVEGVLKNVYQFSDETAKRRTSTVKKWVDWCNIILNEHNFEIEGDEEHGLYQSAS